MRISSDMAKHMTLTARFTLPGSSHAGRPAGRGLFGLAIVLVCSLAPNTSAWSQVLTEYNVRPGDQMEISVWEEVELQRTVLVRP
ncbi:MAG: hypothetical protein O7C39_09305, partial [Bacteroidetes bacterium]|nr:hypothetical protein [Bacteroidota bacterium]